MRHRLTWLATAAALVAVPAVARGHVGAAPQPHDLWQAWSWEPPVLIGLVAAAWLYARGVRTLWARAGHGRGIARWRVGCYAAGLTAVAAALVSPIDAVGAALFSVHMVQHLLLVMVAAPLLVLGEPLTATLWALPVRARRAAGRWGRARAVRVLWRTLRHPLTAWALHVAALWVWHAPRLYDAALRYPGVHVLEHATFFGTALLFWWVIADRRARRRLGFGPVVLYIFTGGLQSTVLGALLAVARRPWYLSHYDTTRAWGLTPLEDQQLAGLIMWVPAGFAYLAALVAYFAVTMAARPAHAAIARTGEPALGRSSVASHAG
jgi:putative membrane protein